MSDFWNVDSRQGSKQIGRRKSIKVLGIDSVIDERFEWRVKWTQRGIGLFGFIALVCHVAAGGTNIGLQIATMVFATITLMFFGILYYKNISIVVMKRLLHEMNVVTILILSLCNFSIEVGRPTDSFSAIFGLLYMLLVNAFVFMDALKVKSRILVIIVGSIFIFFNIFLIYGDTFGDANAGIILLKYTVQGKEYSIMKRSTKRSIYLQILLFSMSGIYTMFTDKNQELMMFATGNIYRETGTSSKHVEDTQYSMKMKREKKSVTSLPGEKNRL